MYVLQRVYNLICSWITIQHHTKKNTASNSRSATGQAQRLPGGTSTAFPTTPSKAIATGVQTGDCNTLVATRHAECHRQTKIKQWKLLRKDDKTSSSGSGISYTYNIIWNNNMSNMYYGLLKYYIRVCRFARNWHNLRYRCGIPESQFWRITWEAGGLFDPWVKSNCFQRNKIDDTAASWRDHVSTFRSPPVKSTPSPQQTACFSASKRRQWMCARETTENLQILKVSLMDLTKHKTMIQQ